MSMHTSYDLGLVALSLGVAVLASFVAFDLVGSVARARGRFKAMWISGGAVAMGMGIWSMHFVGMMALKMPGMPMAYESRLMALSILVAILGSAFALSVMSRPAVSVRATILSSIAMALAIAGMHYIGMLSMLMPAAVEWDYGLVALSVLVAWVASLGALLVATRLREQWPHVSAKAVASLAMGIAIAGMHYTGMSAASFHETEAPKYAFSVVPSNELTLIISIATLLILALALIGSLIERVVAEKAAAEQSSAQKAHDAEFANESKTRFLANMSHEIRTPLGAILGFSEILLKNEIDENERLKFLKTINRSALALSSLLDDILDLSKIEMNRLELDPQIVDVRALLAEVLDLLKIKADHKALGLRFEDEPAVPGDLATDPFRLRQILTNIIGNAIKFTDQGSVRVQLKVWPGGGVAIDVIDSGIGLSAAQKENLFEAFTQGDSSITRRFGGTGLGLNISRQLARALGGDVELLTSALGHGSAFRITLSPVVLAKEVPAARPESPGRLDGRRVLLVEDGPDNQELLSYILRQRGAVVTLAENGALGVEAATQSQFDVILMDMQMPVLSGIDATKRLRALGNATPIVALTAHARREDREACLAAGCNEFVPKPIQVAALVRAISNVIKIY